jgi:hypothetical protein
MKIKEIQNMEGRWMLLFSLLSMIIVIHLIRLFNDLGLRNPFYKAILIAMLSFIGVLLIGGSFFWYRGDLYKVAREENQMQGRVADK